MQLVMSEDWVEVASLASVRSLGSISESRDSSQLSEPFVHLGRSADEESSSMSLGSLDVTDLSFSDVRSEVGSICTEQGWPMIPPTDTCSLTTSNGWPRVSPHLIMMTQAPHASLDWSSAKRLLSYRDALLRNVSSVDPLGTPKAPSLSVGTPASIAARPFLHKQPEYAQHEFRVLGSRILVAGSPRLRIRLRNSRGGSVGALSLIYEQDESDCGTE
mmetsp:Transcript_878/g.1459  ORF Transcript_878/g.1459 Transcript_878/m.1459 type:complete len:217 (+) Transcript_878:27-677(+)